MASFDPQTPYGFADTASSTLAEESARVFMQRVYAWMTAGLALTGGVAFAVAQSPAAMQAILPLSFPLMLGTLGLVFALSMIAPKVSGPVAASMFLGYAFLNGLTFSVIFLVYSLGSITSAFFITATAFAALSVYGTVTKRDLSAWATFLFIGLVGIVVAGIVNIFLQSAMLDFVKSCAAVLIFAGLTAYDTQKLRQYHANSGYSSAAALAVTGALMLYLDFINMFITILRLFGRRR